jgi:hypothetical protein
MGLRRLAALGGGATLRVRCSLIPAPAGAGLVRRLRAALRIARPLKPAWKLYFHALPEVKTSGADAAVCPCSLLRKPAQTLAKSSKRQLREGCGGCAAGADPPAAQQGRGR